ncbi:MAG: hypothetical protein H7Y11_03455 [Armatimonadetes bacterium]|nr:hypothetical protein [Anaerolineae bacterium]
MRQFLEIRAGLRQVTILFNNTLPMVQLAFDATSSPALYGYIIPESFRLEADYGVFHAQMEAADYNTILIPLSLLNAGKVCYLRVTMENGNTYDFSDGLITRRWLEPATRHDWKNSPIEAEDRVRLDYQRSFSKAEYHGLQLGDMPREQQAKWFSFYEPDVLYIHRSWTGWGIYEVHFAPLADGSVTVSAAFSSAQYDPNVASAAALNTYLEGRCAAAAMIFS